MSDGTNTPNQNTLMLHTTQLVWPMSETQYNITHFATSTNCCGRGSCGDNTGSSGGGGDDTGCGGVCSKSGHGRAGSDSIGSCSSHSSRDNVDDDDSLFNMAFMTNQVSHSHHQNVPTEMACS